jgi:hypothetical protein
MIGAIWRGGIDASGKTCRTASGTLRFQLAARHCRVVPAAL